MRILVTGGAGYIGSVLVETLLNEGHEVVVVDNFMYNQTSLSNLIHNPKLELHFGDIRNKDLMSKLISQVDVVLPLAAIVGAPACDRDPMSAKEINNASVIWMFDQLSCDQMVIMPTTNSAYGQGESGNFCDESSPLNPLSLYARDKVEVEQRLMNLPNATSFRLATVFGVSPRMRLDLLVNNFAFRALTDGFIVVFEGNFKRNYIHVRDVVAAFLLALQNPALFAGEIFNVGLSSANISKLELCERIKKEIAPEFSFIEDSFGKDPDQRNYLVSNAKIESRGFTPKVSLEEGLQEIKRGYKMFLQRQYVNA